MDIFIITSDPESINADEIQEAVEDLGYFVTSITIQDRAA